MLSHVCLHHDLDLIVMLRRDISEVSSLNLHPEVRSSQPISGFVEVDGCGPANMFYVMAQSDARPQPDT